MTIDIATLKRVVPAERLEDENLPRLGFGMMRLPTLEPAPDAAESDPVPIDIDQVKDMVDAYLAAGMNYFDTAYMYMANRSESVVGEALVKRYPRDRFFLTSKLPQWMMDGIDDRDRILEDQLARTGAGYFDVYLLHAVEDGKNYDGYVKYDCFEWGKQKKAEGKIRHFGFSYHGTAELLDQILTEHPEVEVVQLQINYLDWDNPVIQSGTCYEVCRKHGVPVLVMEPVKGGTLAAPVPAAAEILQAADAGASAASWALRFVSSLPGVLTTLSGMTTCEQMADNVCTMGPGFHPLTDADRDVLARVVDAMRSAPTVPCTVCRYCTDGCPMGIDIPEIFKALNARRLDAKSSQPKAWYDRVAAAGAPASACIGCGQCEGVCPQHLPIIELLSDAARQFETE